MSDYPYEVGMTVRVKTESELRETFGIPDAEEILGHSWGHIYFCGAMDQVFGTEQVITSIAKNKEDSDLYYDRMVVQLDDHYWWPLDAIEPIEDEDDDSPDIQIDDWKVIALTLERR